MVRTTLQLPPSARRPQAGCNQVGIEAAVLVADGADNMIQARIKSQIALPLEPWVGGLLASFITPAFSIHICQAPSLQHVRS